MVADIACGSGSFLDAALDSILRRLKQRDPARNWANEIIDRRAIRGMDIDEMAVIKTQNRLWLRLASEPQSLPLHDLDAAIVCGDSLASTAKDQIGNDIDVLVGNPPFLAVGRVESRTLLAERFDSAKGRFDYSSLFLEQGLKLLKQDGAFGVVMPNRLLNNRDAQPIRQLLTRSAHILTIVDFGSTEVFKGVSAYIALIVGKATPPPEAAATTIIDIKEVPQHFPEVVLAELTAGNNLNVGDARVFETLLPRSGDPWLLLSPEGANARIRLAEHEPLDSYALVVQGIKTGANDIFVVKVIRESASGIWEVVNGLGRNSFVDSELLRPVVSGSEIKPYLEVQPNTYLVYPYRRGRRLSETELKADYPATWSYLSAYQSLLEARTSLTAGLRWYELIRSREEDWLTRPKLLMRDLAPRVSMALNSAGGIFLIGGTAVVPEDGVQLESLMLYLNSAVSNWYLSTSASPFQNSYYRFDAGQLSKVPVPVSVALDPMFRDEIVEARRRDLDEGSGDGELSRVDELLINLLGLPAGALI